MYATITSERRCPDCGENTHRVRRRFVDRVSSLFTPVQRYRCENPLCGWEGNLRVAQRPSSKALPPGGGATLND